MEGARPAAPEDAPRLAELARTAREELGAQERGGFVFVNREAPAEPGGYVVAGTFNDVVVGYGTGRTETLRDGSVLGVIEDLYVEPEARGVGVGEAVIDLLLDWFGQQSCIGVDAYALPGMRATKNFFEAGGFTARLLVVHKRMDGADGPA